MADAASGITKANATTISASHRNGDRRRVTTVEVRFGNEDITSCYPFTAFKSNDVLHIGPHTGEATFHLAFLTHTILLRLANEWFRWNHWATTYGQVWIDFLRGLQGFKATCPIH